MQVKTMDTRIRPQDSDQQDEPTKSDLPLKQDAYLEEKKRTIIGFLRCIQGHQITIRSELIDRLLKYPDIANDALVLALLSENPHARAMAAFALGKSRNPRIATILIQACRDPNENVRAWAVKSLGEIGNAMALPTLLEALKDESDVVRAEAACSLGLLKDKKAIEYLMQVVSSDNNEKVRIWAGQSIIQIEEALRHQECGKIIECKETAIQQLQNYGKIISSTPLESQPSIPPETGREGEVDSSAAYSSTSPISIESGLGKPPISESIGERFRETRESTGESSAVPCTGSLDIVDMNSTEWLGQVLPSSSYPGPGDKLQEGLPPDGTMESPPGIELEFDAGIPSNVHEEIPNDTQEIVSPSLSVVQDLQTDLTFHAAVTGGEISVKEADLGRFPSEQGPLDNPIESQRAVSISNDSLNDEITTDLFLSSFNAEERACSPEALQKTEGDSLPVTLEMLNNRKEVSCKGNILDLEELPKEHQPSEKRAWIKNAFNDPNPLIRALGVTIAARTTGDQACIATLGPLAHDEDAIVREIARSSLSGTRDASMIPVIAAFLSPVADNHTQETSTNSPLSLHAILPVLQDPSEDVQIWGVWALGNFGKDAIQELVAIVNQGTWDMQREAICALERIGAPAAPMLVSLLAHPSIRVRAEIAAVLSRMDPAVLPCLVEAEAGGDTHARVLASSVLQYAGEAGMKAYIRALRSESEQVRECAKGALAGMGSAAVDPLLAIAAEPDPRIRQVVLEVLVHIYDPRAQNALLGFLSDEEESIRVLAVDAISDRKDDRVIHHLIRALSDASENVRLASVIALGKQKDPQGITPLLKRLKDPSEQIRSAAVQSLAEIGEDLPEPL
jgi:HEAT repeat protein